MQYYSAKLRLSGSTTNEVRGIYSAPEILILQYIHGVDSIIEIEKFEVRKLNLREYKDTLKAKYDSALVRREQSIDKIFGALGQLPTQLPDHIFEDNTIEDEDDVISVAKSVTKSDKGAGNVNMPKDSAEAQRLDKVIPQAEVSMDDIME